MSKRNGQRVIDAEWTPLDDDNNEGRNGASDSASDTREIVLVKEHQRFYDRLRRKIEEFIKQKTGGRFEGAEKYILLAPDFFVLFARLMQDPLVPKKSKAIAGIVVAYFISPVDIIPEAVFGPLGFLDDIVLAVYALNRIINEVDQSIVLKHWNGEADLLKTVQDILRKADELVGNRVLSAIKRRLNK